MACSAHAELLLSSFNDHRVYRYNETNGAFLDVFIPNTNGLPEVLPALGIFPTATNVFLVWPASFAGFRLEQSPVIPASAGWISVTNAVDIANGSNAVTLPLDPENRFFRLTKP